MDKVHQRTPRGEAAPIAARPASVRTAPCPAGLRALVRASRAQADLAADLGFEGIVVSPSGESLHPGAFRDFKRPVLPGPMQLVIRIPWQRHHGGSPLPGQRPDWFERTRPRGGVIDPRRLAGSGGLAVALQDDEAAAGYATWLLDLIEGLAPAEPAAIWLGHLGDAPDAFTETLANGMKPSGVALIADGFGSTRRSLKDLDGLGFAALVDPSASWNGTDPWFPADVADLETATLSLGLPPGLAARDPDTAEERLLRCLVTSAGHLLSLEDLEGISPEFVRELNRLRREAVFGEKSVLRFAGQDSVARFNDDPRIADRALLFGSDLSRLIRTLGGRFSGMTTLKRKKNKTLAKAEPARSEGKRKTDKGADLLRELAPRRIAIENVYPSIDGGRFPAKRIVGDVLEVGADIFCDGHEKLAADLIVTEPGSEPVRIPMEHRGNDRWTARHRLERMGRASFDIEAWRDQVATWRDEVAKKKKAGQDVRLETIEGRDLILPQLRDIAQRNKDEGSRAGALADRIAEEDEGSEAQLHHLTGDALHDLLRDHGVRHQAGRLAEPLHVRVDREQARFSSWYELFPRSMSGDPERHGTFRDVIERLPYIQDLGFDVLYFPPIHPIGKTNRKGRNNTLTPEEHDVGSPYAIGSEEGGHDALHPELGSFEDFADLVDAARGHGLEIALDFAIQCSPDHPWLKQHKEWFDWRPDGTIKFAENPPKKYEDIVNVHFYREAIPDLWYALRDIVLFWCEKGVRMFRVDNPHTKPYPFWEWMIAEVKEAYPDALFLSEAFTRPKVMKRLAKLGFTQSYTYFTWRNTKHGLTEYVSELTQTGTREVMNPNFFVNTPDINPPVLQTNNRDAYIARTWLAGTLASSYGIYNGVEIAEGTPLPGKEEYLDSEKYQIRVWDMDREGHIKDEIRLLNRVRRQHPAMQDHCTVRFLNAYNDQILWYAKATPDLSDVVLCAISLDFENDQRASIEIPLWYFGLPDDGSIDAVDLFTGNAFTWNGKMQEITLGPGRIARAFALKPPAGFVGADRVLYDDREDF